MSSRKNRETSNRQKILKDNRGCVFSSDEEPEAKWLLASPDTCCLERLSHTHTPSNCTFHRLETRLNGQVASCRAISFVPSGSLMCRPWERQAMLAESFSREVGICSYSSFQQLFRLACSDNESISCQIRECGLIMSRRR